MSTHNRLPFAVNSFGQPHGLSPIRRHYNRRFLRCQALKTKKWLSRKVRGANKGLGEAPKSCTRKEHESATNSIAKRGQGAIAPCRVKGQRPLWGLGQRPNCSAGDQHLKRTQQRRRQRSVPAPNFARPQTRPQAALPPRFREEPFFVKSKVPEIPRFQGISGTVIF